MSQFKEYLVRKNIDVITSISSYSNAFFTFNTSEEIQNLIDLFSTKISGAYIRNVLVDTSLVFEDLKYKNDSYSNHEDLIEAGYILGLIHASHHGAIYSVTHQFIRYFFVGVESDICIELRSKFKKKMKLW